jgi:hypothetical protein
MVVLENGIQNLFQPFILMEKRALLHQTLLVENRNKESLYLRLPTDYRPVAELAKVKGVQKKNQ